jgi:hypothetical protein
MRTITSKIKWDKVKQDIFKEQLCPRCNNFTKFHLCLGTDSYHDYYIFKIRYSKFYSYKCEICIYYELIHEQTFNSLIKKYDS